MEPMTLDDLRAILADCAGEDDAVDLRGEIADATFDELGYDSLALMEMAAWIQQRYGVRVPDDQVTELRTPRALLELVNSL